MNNNTHFSFRVGYFLFTAIPSRLLHNPIYEPCSRCSEFRLCTLTCTFLRKQIFAANERKHKHVVVGILNYFSCSNLRHCRVKLVHFFPQKFRGGGRPIAPPSARPWSQVIFFQILFALVLQNAAGGGFLTLQIVAMQG